MNFINLIKLNFTPIISLLNFDQTWEMTHIMVRMEWASAR